MGLWAKSLRIFNAFCDNAKQSIRQVAHRTGLSKSSVHRLKQAMEHRGHCQVVGGDMVTRQQQALSGRDFHRSDA